MGEKSKNFEVFNPIYFPSQTTIPSHLQKEFDPVPELREEDDPPVAAEPDKDEPEEKNKSKVEEAEKDSNEESGFAHEKVRGKEKSATEDWEAMRRAVVQASAR